MNRLLAVLFLFSCATHAADVVEFDITGLKIGDKLTEKFRYSHCPAKDKGKSEVNCRKTINVGETEIFVAFHFFDFKLMTVMLLYDASSYDDLIAAYTSKFGRPPHDTEEQDVETKVGVKYKNSISTWNTNAGAFIVRKFGSSVNKGYAVLMSPEYESYLAEKKKQENKSLSDQL